MFAKLHEKDGELILAACDEEHLGKTLKHKKLKFEVDERFYKGHKVDAKELGKMLNKCTIANLVGEKVINVAKKNKVIEKKHVMFIGKVPHAQMTRMMR